MVIAPACRRVRRQAVSCFAAGCSCYDENVNDLGLKDEMQEKRPMLAPAWVALATAWGGVLMLIASIVFIFLPGSRDPVGELEHRVAYSMKDRFLPVPMYGIALVLFLGIVVLWQMRKEPRPLDEPLVNQRVQAWVGIVLAIMGAVVVYVYVALRGPRA